MQKYEIKYVKDSVNYSDDNLYDLLYVDKKIPVHQSWLPFFEKPEIMQQVKKISDYLAQQVKDGYAISPTIDRVFEAFILTGYDSVSCVILGQDPAPEPHLATGLSFSVDPHINTSLVSSIQRVLLELINEGFDVNTVRGDLTYFAKQGVFLLNTILTIPIDPQRNYGIVDAHKAIWLPFTKLLLQYLDINERPISFILWGNQAKSFKKFVTRKNHLTIEGEHPSPLLKNGRFFCQSYFTDTNAFLKKSGSKEIDWNLIQKGSWEWDAFHRMSIFKTPCT